jgi:hypothetical protein
MMGGVAFGTVTISLQNMGTNLPLLLTFFCSHGASALVILSGAGAQARSEGPAL